MVANHKDHSVRGPRRACRAGGGADRERAGIFGGAVSAKALSGSCRRCSIRSSRRCWTRRLGSRAIVWRGRAAACIASFASRIEAKNSRRRSRKLLPDVDMIIVFGASALCDFDDVIPHAIRSAGGSVERAGMPVDPGNCWCLDGSARCRSSVAPGCARRPQENGFDWILDRLSAGLEVSMPTSGHGCRRTADGDPEPAPGRAMRRRRSRPEVHAVVLAAGRSSRMGGPKSWLARFDGVALVRRTVEAVLGSTVSGVTVITGTRPTRSVRRWPDLR